LANLALALFLYKTFADRTSPSTTSRASSSPWKSDKERVDYQNVLLLRLKKKENNWRGIEVVWRKSSFVADGKKK